MPDRRLVVTDADSASADYGKMFALAPNSATGIAIPSFKVGTSRPAVGTTNGEGFYDTTTRQGYVWDGTGWRDIAANPILQFATDALLVADTSAAVGSYAISTATGNLYFRKTAGWQRLGVTSYPTVADLLGDTPLTGAIAVAADEDTLWARTPTGWRCLVPREFLSTGQVVAWTGTAAQGANVGDEAVDTAHGLFYVRTFAGWRPTSLWEDTEASIRAATWPLNGQEAIATDTGRTFVRIGGAWIEEPIAHFATEALLLAATPPDGTLAWSDDTQVVFTRAAGAWNRLQGPQISIGTTVPATPGAGDMFMNSTTNVLQVSDGTTWHVPQSAGGVVGDVRQSLLTEAQFATALGAESASWVLCDGRSVAGTVYATITGRSTVPDLRGAYLRMAGTNASNSSWSGGSLNGYQEDSTARPKSAFTTNQTGNHDHGFVNGLDYIRTSGSSHDLEPGGGGAHEGKSTFRTQGDHSHTITGGGDAETRPKSYSVNYFIKVR